MAGETVKSLVNEFLGGYFSTYIMLGGLPSLRKRN